MTRRRPADPGLRPKGRFCAGTCHCGERFVIDRAVQPWARARTCSDACARRRGNRGRTPANCRHCAMVEEYASLRSWHEYLHDNGQNPDGSPGGFRDEDAHLLMIQFRTWLIHYRYEHERYAA